MPDMQKHRHHHRGRLSEVRIVNNKEFYELLVEKAKLDEEHAQLLKQAALLLNETTNLFSKAIDKSKESAEIEKELALRVQQEGLII
jgi:hypothetical protein